MSLHYVHRTEAPEPELDIEPEAEPSPVPERAQPVPLHPVARNERETAAPEAPGPVVSRVHQTLVSADDEQPIHRAEALKGFEVEPDRYVVFEPQELKGLRRRTSAEMEIVRSVRLPEIDPVFFETSYYVVPDRGGERPYGILFAALRKIGHVALARVGMHGREHVVIIRPGKHGLIAHTMFYVDEIRFENEFRTDLQAVGSRELELATTFLEAIEGPFAPEEFKDTYRKELEALIAKKAAHERPAASAAPEPAAPPVVDILEALKKSIALARKPAASETQAQTESAAPRKKRAGRR